MHVTLAAVALLSEILCAGSSTLKFVYRTRKDLKEAEAQVLNVFHVSLLAIEIAMRMFCYYLYWDKNNLVESPCMNIISGPEVRAPSTGLVSKDRTRRGVGVRSAES